MVHKASAISGYNFTQDDHLLLDANIWLFIYAPHDPHSEKVRIYSQALKKMLEAQCHIYIDVLIISEFINTCARLQWHAMDRPQKNFKKFRKSQDFKPIAEDIALYIKRILDHCSLVKNAFGTSDIDKLMDEYAKGDSDFNDQIIAVLCQKNELTLITDDRDFRGQKIPIVTANKRLM